MPTMKVQEPDEFVPVERDLKMLNAICECGGLTALQLSRLYFPLTFLRSEPYPHANCQVRLKKLRHGNFIVPVKQYQLLSEGRKPYVYRLTTKGRKTLAAWRDCQSRDLPCQERDYRLGHEYVAHLVLNNDVRVAFMRAVEDSTTGARIKIWRDEIDLKRDHSPDKMTITFPSGREEQNVVLLPDAYVLLEVSTPSPRQYHRFFEVDRATEIVRSSSGYDDWGRKIQKYREYTKKGGFYQQRYGVESIAVLTVTTSDTHLANLKAITEEMGGKRRFWFTTFDRISPTTILTEPIWEIASKEGLYPFLESM
jgi:DNA-binding PadR family transcriptional regulator